MAHRTIAQIAAATAAKLRQAAPRARERTLSEGDIARAIRAHLRMAQRVHRQAPEDTVETVARGGFVANSYKYRASADAVRITGRTIATIEITAERAPAQSRTRGQGSWLIHRARRPGQPMGRILWASTPAA